MAYTSIPIMKAKATPDDVEAMAEKLSPTIAKAVGDALQQSADTIDLDALAAALERGDLNAAYALIGEATAKATMAGAVKTLQDAAWAGGALVPLLVRPRISGATFEFNRLEPRLTDWLNTYSLGLIRQINDTTKEGVRAVLVSGMEAGKNPRDQARDIKQIVGLTDRMSKAVLNFRKELETFHARKSAAAWGIGTKIDRVNGHQVFKPGEDGTPKDGIDERRLRDFRYDGQLATAMKTGKPLKPEQIDKMVDAYARKYRKYRADNIARTESMRTLNMGVQEGFRQAVEGGTVSEKLLRRKWKTAKDERLCKVCSPVPSLNPNGVAFSAPFSTPAGPVFLPPIHPSCRCHIWISILEPQQLNNA